MARVRQFIFQESTHEHLRWVPSDVILNLMKTANYSGPKNGTHGLVAQCSAGVLVFRFKSEAHADAKLAFYAKHGQAGQHTKVALVDGLLAA